MASLGEFKVPINFVMTEVAQEVLRHEIRTILFQQGQDGGDAFTAWVRGLVHEELKDVLPGELDQLLTLRVRSAFSGIQRNPQAR